MINLSVDFFHSLKDQLTEQKQKKATWEEVALYCESMNFDIFKNKNSKAVCRKLNDYNSKGIPAKVKLLFFESDFYKLQN